MREILTFLHVNNKVQIQGHVAQLLTCLTAETCLSADPEVASWKPARSHTFAEIDHEIISTAILLLPLIQEGLLSVTRESMCTKHWLTAMSSLPRKKVWLGEFRTLAGYLKGLNKQSSPDQTASSEAV